MSLPLHDPEFYLGDVQAVYRRLRAEAPVYWSEAAGLWALTKYADIQRVSKDPATFCSSRGVIVNDPLRLAGDLPTPPSIIHMDPPAHNRYRKLVSGAFTPRAVAMLEPRIRELVRETLAAAPANGSFDFVEHVAVPVPLLVIAEMLGVPPGDRDTFRRWSDAVIAGADADAASAMMGEIAELFAYFQEMLGRRRAEPRADLISALATGVVDGDRLSDEEILMFCMTLLVAGNETTRNLVAGGTRTLLEHPDELARLRRDPALLPGAIEEMLRWVSPIRCFIRTATRDTEIRGTAIPEGAVVALFYASGNRDEEVFGPTAGEFRIDRPLEPAHLAFGFGEHFCLGASLARLEARLMFEGILGRWSRLEIAGPVDVLPSTLMNGLVRLPVRAWA
ncbi:MAG TPA: cytochrome P450 [Candidatus Limnocylindria bacterium]|nr:cytochrome P450 [Candidatus Limnocylindria bacterium]